ncbi:transposase [Chryseobacterium sp. ERMR1:04]|uniref:transposase n=1 Tax=Chryseobacterium sp. ERMR1:04 TaxID=1705393 RepID=UPI0006C83498|nr:transposase [Chryseobacterium sp. ERMR1:04]KPH14774.1 transposase [Chryseobacterium sp. ERMR1:04]
MKNNAPNYKKIYADILDYKFPEQKEKYTFILNKSELSVLDILKLNKMIFKDENQASQKFKSYTKEDILEILEYQKNNNLNNTQVASYFKMSRNTLGKWKKLYQ